MADEPTLSTGETGEWVTYLQQMLAYRQFGSGFIDGTYCDATEQAVRTLQQQSLLSETGQCDAATWAALTAEHGSSGDEVAGYETSGGDAPPADFAICMADELAAPADVEFVADLEPLPGNVMVA